MKALISWDDDGGFTHRWELLFNDNDPEARHFFEALQLHVRFRLDAFEPEAIPTPDADPQADADSPAETAPAPESAGESERAS
jgi:hypothetical protein